MGQAVYQVVGHAYQGETQVGYVLMDCYGNQGVVSSSVAYILASHGEIANASAKLVRGRQKLVGRSCDLRTLRKIQIAPGATMQNFMS